MTEAEGDNGHEPRLLDETAAGEDGEDRNTESAELNQPTAREGGRARAMAEASFSPSEEANVVGVEREGNKSAGGLLNEAPEENCHVG